MKRIAYLILIAIPSILLSGCGDDSPTQGQEPEIEYFEITGQLSRPAIDTTQMMALYKGKGIFKPLDSLASSPIDTAGNFTIKVPPPSQSILQPIKEIFFAFGIEQEYEQTPFVSDTLTKFIQGIIVVLENKKPKWTTDWTSMLPVGMGWESYTIRYFYFDRDVEIDGNLIKTGNTPVVYRITAKKGWNAIFERTMTHEGTSYINYYPLSQRGWYSGFSSIN